MPPRIRKPRSDAEKELRRVKPKPKPFKKKNIKVLGWRKSWPTLPRMKAVIISSVSHAVDSKPVNIGELTEMTGEFVAGSKKNLRRISSPKDKRGNYHAAAGEGIPKLMSVDVTEEELAQLSRGQVSVGPSNSPSLIFSQRTCQNCHHCHHPHPG